MLLMGLSAGADGGIGTTYNFMLPRIRRVYECFCAGKIDEAREAQIEADRIIYALLKHPTIPATKVALEAMGFAVGDATFPFPAFSDEEKKDILADLRAAGLEV
jgi:N-acetylneuraminate lyase